MPIMLSRNCILSYLILIRYSRTNDGIANNGAYFSKNGSNNSPTRWRSHHWNFIVMIDLIGYNWTLYIIVLEFNCHPVNWCIVVKLFITIYVSLRSFRWVAKQSSVKWLIQYMKIAWTSSTITSIKSNVFKLISKMCEL